jgi:hypothetical protein
MGKIAFFTAVGFIVFVVTPIVLWYLITEVNRRRTVEDRLQLKQARRDALEEFEQSQDSIEEFLTRDYNRVQ